MTKPKLDGIIGSIGKNQQLPGSSYLGFVKSLSYFHYANQAIPHYRLVVGHSYPVVETCNPLPKFLQKNS